MLGSESPELGFLNRIGKMLLSPKEQIRQTIHEQRTVLEPILLASLVWGVVGALWATAAAGIFSSFASFFPSLSPQLPSFIPPVLVAGAAISGVTSVLVTGSLTAAIMHFTARALGGQGFYQEAIRATFYSFLPYGFVAIPLAFAVLAPLPMIILASGIGVLAFVWQVYVLFESFKEIYGTGGGRTLAVLLSPLVVALVFSAIIVAIVFIASGGVTI